MLSLSSIEKLQIKLANDFLFFKHFYPYYFSHKPLCEKFKDDTFVINNKIYLCKSCVCIYSGMLLALATFSYIKIDLTQLLFFTSLIVLLSAPAIYKKYSRTTRNCARFSTGFLVVLLLLKTFIVSPLLSILFLLSFMMLIQIKKVK